MAPELLVTPRRHKQSHKSDVWALYVTLLWMLDVADVRIQEVLGGHSTVSAMEFAESVVVSDGGRSVGDVPPRAMGRRDPGWRWSAGKVLDDMFDGIGRVTTE